MCVHHKSSPSITRRRRVHKHLAMAEDLVLQMSVDESPRIEVVPNAEDQLTLHEEQEQESHEPAQQLQELQIQIVNISENNPGKYPRSEWARDLPGSHFDRGI